MMESMVLSSLNFRISMPTVFTFLSLYQQAVSMSPKAEALSSYIAVCCPLALSLAATSLCQACPQTLLASQTQRSPEL